MLSKPPTFRRHRSVNVDVEQNRRPRRFRSSWCAQRDARAKTAPLPPATSRLRCHRLRGPRRLRRLATSPRIRHRLVLHTTVDGWAPYRYGHWVYIAPWGYTWVEDEPWGYAPFHYGRWVTVGGVWGWVLRLAPVVGVAYVRPGLCARAGCLGRRTALRCRRRRQRRLVPARSARSLRSRVSGQPRLRHQHQRHEHACRNNRRQQLLHHRRRQ